MARGFGFLGFTFLILSLISVQPTSALMSESVRTQIEHDAALAAQGKFSDAETNLREIVNKNPNSFPAYKLLGFIYMREGKYAAAEKNLKVAVQLAHAKDPQSLYYLSKVEFKLKKSHEALEMANEALALAPDNSRALYSIGRLLRENSFSSEAVHVLGKAHNLVPSNIAFTTELILAYSDQRQLNAANTLFGSLLHSASYEDLLLAGSRFGNVGRNGLAIRAFQRAVELRPKAFDGQFNLAFSYYRQHDFMNALAVLDRIPASESVQHTDYHYLRGKVQLASGHDVSAKNQFRMAVNKDPGNESLCTEAGLLFLHFEDFWQALNIFSRCSQALPRSSSVLTGLGLTYFHLGKYPQAIETFRKVLVLKPDADAARESLAFLLYVSGKSGQAGTILEQRMKSGDADYYIYYLNALTLLREDPRRNRVRALASIEEALKRNPRFPPAFFERGRIEFAAGHFPEALADFQKATQLNPNYAEPYALMARAYYKLGNRAKADQAQRRYIAFDHEQVEKEQKQQLQDRLFQALK